MAAAPASTATVPPAALAGGMTAIAIAIVVALLLLTGGVAYPGHPTLPVSPYVPAYVPVTVHSHSGSVNAGPSTATPAVDVPAESTILLFVGYVNTGTGGGYVNTVADSSGDLFELVATTGFAQNHTEDLYVASGTVANPGLTAWVDFAGGATPFGGSVALVDIVSATTLPSPPRVDAIAVASGAGVTASLTVIANQSGDLFLLGVSGQRQAAPFQAEGGATLLDTAGATSGPYSEGIGFGTFVGFGTTFAMALGAGLNASADWNAIGIGVSGSPLVVPVPAPTPFPASTGAASAALAPRARSV